MAARSSSIDALAYYLVVGGATVILYRLALQGTLGEDAKKQAIEVWKALHPGKTYMGVATSSKGSNPGGAVQPSNSPASGPYKGVPGMQGKIVPLALRDFGGVPVAYSVDLDTIVQNVPNKPNVYHPNDIFFDSGGQQYQYQGQGQLVDMASGAIFSVQLFVSEQ